MRRTTTKLTLLGVALATGLASQAAVAEIVSSASLFCDIDLQEKIKKTKEDIVADFVFKSGADLAAFIDIEILNGMAHKPIKFKVIYDSVCTETGELTGGKKKLKLKVGKSRKVVLLPNVPPDGCSGADLFLTLKATSGGIWEDRVWVGDVSSDSFLSLAVHIQDLNKCKFVGEECFDDRECCSLSCPDAVEPGDLRVCTE